MNDYTQILHDFSTSFLVFLSFIVCWVAGVWVWSFVKKITPKQQTPQPQPIQPTENTTHPHAPPNI